jgi:hypothetical protein
MRDYFGALAARTLQPEQGVRPRHRVRWEEAPQPPVDGFAAISREAIAGAPRPSEPAEGERPPRSNRRSNAEADPSGNEPLTTRSGRDHTVRERTTDHDESKIAASAAMPHPAVRTAEPPVQVRSERVDRGSGHVPAIKRPGIEDGRVNAVAASRGTERALHVPTRLSVRDRERAASEPAIRIHIGRVDVRAVTTAVPGPPASRESKRALMSLDEYVQKRDRGAS